MRLSYRPIYKAFTFIELIIVVSIILIVTAVAIPAFDGMAEKKNFRISVENFATELRLTRNKALSGVGVGDGNLSTFAIDDDTLLGWGLSPTCGANSYEVQYRYMDSSIGSEAVARDENQIRSLDDGIKFDSTDSTTCDDVFFGRLTGIPFSAQTIVIMDDSGNYSANVKVNSSGQIIVVYN